MRKGQYTGTSSRECSVYASEAYGEYGGPYCRLRRFTYRIDGFVSVHASDEGGELVTKPLIFAGDNLALNFATSGGGSVRVELQAADGEPLPGLNMNDCPPIVADSIEHVVAWKGGSDVSKYAGTPVRIRFVMRDCDVYSLRFR